MSLRCWSCAAEVGEGQLSCPFCSKIQPFPEGTDYFRCLGLKRFLVLDLQDLEKRFYALSRQIHPDFHHTKDPGEQEISLKNSALLNRAYRTLRDPFSRAEYLILLEEGGKDGIAAKMPQAFLEEVFSLQETLEEFRSASDAPEKERLGEKLRETLRTLEKRLQEEEEQLFEHFRRWDGMIAENGAASDARKKELLHSVKELLSYRTYLVNLIEDGRHLLEGHTERRPVRH